MSPWFLLSDFKLRQRASVSAEAYGPSTLLIRLLANDLRCTLHLNWLLYSLQYLNRCSGTLLLIKNQVILTLLLSLLGPCPLRLLESEETFWSTKAHKDRGRQERKKHLPKLDRVIANLVSLAGAGRKATPYSVQAQLCDVENSLSGYGRLQACFSLSQVIHVLFAGESRLWRSFAASSNT